MDKNYIASLKEINAIIMEIEFPNNYFVLSTEIFNWLFIQC